MRSTEQKRFIFTALHIVIVSLKCTKKFMALISNNLGNEISVEYNEETKTCAFLLTTDRDNIFVMILYLLRSVHTER